MGASAAYTLTPQINKNIKYKIDDFTHLATLTYPSDAIVVKADSPYKTLKDMIEAHKKEQQADLVCLAGLGLTPDVRGDLRPNPASSSR